jgi:hypothetical protein
MTTNMATRYLIWIYDVWKVGGYLSVGQYLLQNAKYAPEFCSYHLFIQSNALFFIHNVQFHMIFLTWQLVWICYFSGWGETESTWYIGHCWPIVPAPDDRWWLWSSWWNGNRQGKPKYSEKTCPNATLSTTNPTWPDLGSNPGRRGGKPATNPLSYGTSRICYLLSVVTPRKMSL